MPWLIDLLVEAKIKGDLMRLSIKFLFWIFLVVLLSIPVAGEEKQSDLSGASVYYERSKHGPIDGFDVKTSNYLIEEGFGRITDRGDGTVSLYGYTRANKICNEISIQIILQRKDGSSWTNVHSHTYLARYDDYAWGSRVVAVERGKEYRLRTVHKASDHSVNDEISQVTGSIIVK